MWIVGIVFLVAALVFFLIRRSQASKLAQVMAAETLTCAGVERFCKDQGQPVGPSVSTQIAVQGTIEVRTPLKAELSGQDCVCFKTRVEREYEEERWENAPNEKSGRRLTTHRGSETVASNERLEPFYVRDTSGRILVDPQGADVDWVQSVDRFEHGEPQAGLQLLSGLILGTAGVAVGGRKTLGYRYHEWVLPAGRSAYVLGGATLRGGEPCIQASGQPGKRFIVSTKSGEQIAAGARRAMLWLGIACGVSALAGIALILVGLIRH
jgi:hypothetical protein